MKVYIALLLLGVVTVHCQRRGQQGSGNPSRGTSGGRRQNEDVDMSGSDRDHGDSSSGSDLTSGGGPARFPNFARVEVEIQRLENGGGILSNGKSCDFTGACDPVVQVFLDTDSPLSPFPGTSLPIKKWPVIFEATNVNSPTIGKTVNRDICGGSLNKVNLRAFIGDSDSLSSADEIGQFECIFTLDPRDITGDALSSKWGPSMECKVAAQQGKIKLFARQRAYQIPAANCRASTDSGDGKLNSDLAGANPGAKVPGQHDYVRIDTEITQLLNPQGLLQNKKNCDSTSKCDPRINVYLDTDKPLAAWPGSKTVPEYQNIFQISNTDSPVVNKNVSKNICGGSVGMVNLRVNVIDVNGIMANNLIENFECMFTADYRLVAPDVSSAEWSSTMDCKPQHSGNDIRLQYRYRIYDISERECGIGVPKKG